MVLPDNQNWGSIEDRRIRTAENTNQENDHEVTDGVAAKQGKGKQGEHHGELGVDRAIKRLHDGMVDHLFIFDAAVDIRVFPDPVEYHDGIVYRETNNRQYGSQEEGSRLPSAGNNRVWLPRREPQTHRGTWR